MKKGLKQILLIFVVLSVFITTSLCLFSCGSGRKDPTSGGNITLPPSKTTSDSSTGPNSSSTGPSVNPSTSPSTSPSTTPSTTPSVDPPIGQYINPLTGLPTTSNLYNKRPVAIVVDNIDKSYAHQTGLNQADVLYEALVAPGITRFLMVVADYSTISPVCNVRSARKYHMDLAANHNSVLVAHNGETWNDFVTVAAQRLGGGWSTVYNKNLFGYVNTKEEYAFGTKEGGAKYGTIKYYTQTYASRVDLKYDTLVTASALSATFGSKTSLFSLAGGTINGQTTQSLKFVTYGTQKNMDGAYAASRVDLHFTMDNYQGSKDVFYVYDSASGKYLRYQDGSAHVDSQTHIQLSATNLITLFTDVTNNKSGLQEDPNVTSMVTTGSGTGYYFHGGKCIAINWSKPTWNSPLMLTTSNGTELTLACGNTHIAYLDNSNTATAVTFN